MKIKVQGEDAYCYTNNREIDPARESVVFIHGAGMDHTVWTMYARHFARHGRNVVAVDLPGHGRSEGDPRASVEAMADWIVDLLDALGLESAALAGHSLGSLVALDCASRHPARTRALAMVGTSAPMPVSEAILDAAKADDHAAFDRGGAARQPRAGAARDHRHARVVQQAHHGSGFGGVARKHHQLGGVA